MTFGIRPKFPHTGYGYLERGGIHSKAGGLSVYRLKRFTEKPSEKKAAAFVKSGRYYWNSGIFVWRADRLLEAARKYQPVIYRLARKIVPSPLSHHLKVVGLPSPRTGEGSHKKGNKKGKKGTVPLKGDSPILRGALHRFFPRMPSLSIDYGLMEKLHGRILTIPVDMDWSDLGNWNSLHGLWPEDSAGNIYRGPVLAIESSGNVVKAGRRLIALLGVKDLVVVDSGDAILVAPKTQTESIRRVVARLKEKKWLRYL